jgi:hypothetical protein
MPCFVARRALAWNGAVWTVFQVLEVGREKRWPDKSTAVGRGACGWDRWRICASHRICLLAFIVNNPAFPGRNAPSLPFWPSEYVPV